jgi:hypothetical protein
LKIKPTLLSTIKTVIKHTHPKVTQCMDGVSHLIGGGEIQVSKLRMQEHQPHLSLVDAALAVGLSDLLVNGSNETITVSRLNELGEHTVNDGVGGDTTAAGLASNVGAAAVGFERLHDNNTVAASVLEVHAAQLTARLQYLNSRGAHEAARAGGLDEGQTVKIVDRDNVKFRDETSGASTEAGQDVGVQLQRSVTHVHVRALLVKLETIQGHTDVHEAVKISDLSIVDDGVAGLGSTRVGGLAVTGHFVLWINE